MLQGFKMLADGNSTSRKIESHKYAYRLRYKNVYLDAYNIEFWNQPKVDVIYSWILKKYIISVFKGILFIQDSVRGKIIKI